MTDLREQIETAAARPASAAAVDGQSASQQNLRDQIEADRYLRSVEAARRRRPGVRFVKLVPRGMT